MTRALLASFRSETPANATATATATPFVCQYTFTEGTDPIVLGSTDTGNHCEDCDTFVALPFPFQLYDQTFNAVYVNSNGRLDFVCINEPEGYRVRCLPPPPNVCPFDYTIFGLWNHYLDFTYDFGCSIFPNSHCGIFTSVSGTTPNRVFNIDWQVVLYFDIYIPVNFEVRLYENDPNKRFDIIFGTVPKGGSEQSWVSGVQGPGGVFTEDFCDIYPFPASGSRTYTCPGGGTPTPTPTASPTPTATPTGTPSATPTCTPGGSPAPWTVVAPYPEILESTAVSNDGTFAYSAGGRGPTNGFYRYDPVANTWTTLAPLPLALYDARSTYAANVNKVYVFGGFVSGNVLNTNYIYDIATNSWTTGVPMPDGRYFPNVAYYGVNGKIYVIGGFDPSFTEQGQTWEYDPVANTWNTSRTNDPVPQGGSATSIVGQYIYLAGSLGAGGGTNFHYRYDVLGDTWAAMAPVPVDVFEAAGAAIENQTYVIGGGNPNVGPAANAQARKQASIGAPAMSYNSTYIYDIPANSWVIGPNTYVAHSFTGGTAIRNRLLVVCGFDLIGDTHVVEMSVTGGCASPTPTATPTATATATAIATATATPTVSATPTATVTPSATATATATATAIATATATATPTASATPTATVTPTATATASSSPTATPTSTPRGTPTPRPRPAPAPRP